MDLTRLKRGYLFINKMKYPVFEGLNPIGRSKQSTVMILDHTVSHQQATIVIIKDKHYICDMDSCNGTQLDHLKLFPLQLYEISDKKKIHFGNVKAIYGTVLQESGASQEHNRFAHINDSIFDMPTQSMSTEHVGSAIDSRAIGDHANFESCLTVQAEPYENEEIIEPPVNENNIRDIEAALQEETNRINKIEKQREVEVVTVGELSNVSFHELPTQLIEDDFDELPCSTISTSIVSDSLKTPNSKKDKKDTSGTEEVTIYDMPTQIIVAPDDLEVNDDLQNVPDKTWDEDFFVQKTTTIYDEPTQLIATTEMEPSTTVPGNPPMTEEKQASTQSTSGDGTKNDVHSLSTQIDGEKALTTVTKEQNEISLSNEAAAVYQNHSINSLPTQLANIRESSDSEEEISPAKTPNESIVVEESIISNMQNENIEDMHVDEDSNCSADFLTMQTVTQFFEDNLRDAGTVQVFVLQTGIRSDMPSDDETPPTESAENNSGSTTTTTLNIGSKSSDDNFSCSLKTNDLKRKLKNIITSDDESRDKAESSDNTDVEMESVSQQNLPSSLKTNLLKNKVRNIITSDDDEEKQVDEKKIDEELSEGTSVDSQINTKRKKKLTKRVSFLRDAQAPDSDSDDSDEVVIKRKTAPHKLQKIDEINDDESSSETDVEKDSIPKEKTPNITLNDSDFVPATQDCLPNSTSNLSVEPQQAKVASRSGSINSEESQDYSLNLMLTESLPFEDGQMSRNDPNFEKSIADSTKEMSQENAIKNIENDRKGGSKETEKVSDTKTNLTIVHNDDEDIFGVDTQPIPEVEVRKTQSSISLVTHPDDVDDIFLTATQEITQKEPREIRITSYGGNNMILGDEDDIFGQPTQALNQECILTTNNENEDIFLQETQPILPVEKSICAKETQADVEMKSMATTTEENLFLQPTKSAISKSKIPVFTLTSVSRTSELNKKSPLRSENCDDDIFMQPTQPLYVGNSGKPVENTGCNRDDEDIFMQETQPILPVEKSICAKETQADVEMKSMATATEENLFLQPARPAVSESKISVCTLASASKTSELNKKSPLRSENCDDDIFMQPTQPLYVDNSEKPVENTCNKDDEDIFMQATQAITSNKEKPEEVTNDEDDIFLQATQPVEIYKTGNNTAAKDEEGDISSQSKLDLSSETPECLPNTDVKKPNLKICKLPVIQVRGDIFNSPPNNADTIEAKMQQLFQSQQSQDDALYRAAQRLQPSIEFQLEVLFASQPHLCARNEFRPQNPLANILENLQMQNEIILPSSEETERTTEKDDDSLKSQRKKEEEETDNQEKIKELDKMEDQDKNINREKVKDQQEPTEQDKTKEPDIKDHENNKDLGDKAKDAHTKGDCKEKSKSHKKTEKSRHREGRKKDKESNDPKDSDEKKEKKRERKSKNEDELLEILQASKVEKEKARREAQKTHIETESSKENESLKEKPSSTALTRDSSPANKIPKKTVSKKQSSGRSSEKSKSPMDSPTRKGSDSGKANNKASLVPLTEIESTDNLKSTIPTEYDEVKNKRFKRSRASSSSSVEKKHSLVFEGEDLSRKRTRAQSSSPLEYNSSRLDASGTKKKHIKTSSSENESKPEIVVEKVRSSKRTASKVELQESKANRTSTGKKDEDKESTDTSKKPTRRSHRTQKSSKSPSPQPSDRGIGDITVKTSISTTKIMENSIITIGDDSDSSHSLRKAKRKSSNDYITQKSRQKKHKRGHELSLIEELPESSEKTDLSRPSVEIIDLCDSDNNKEIKTKPVAKSIKKEAQETTLKASKSSYKISHAPTTPTCSRTEDDSAVIKRTRQKHRRHSSTSEDDFIVKTMTKRSRLDIPTLDVTQSSNMSDSTFSNSSFPGTPERSRRKMKPKVVFTMMDSPELESLIRRLGGSVVDTVESSTVLMTITVKRSLKLLTAVGQGKPICSPSWLEECKKANKFLDPWDYILRDQEAEKKWNFSLEVSLNRSQGKKLFQDYVMVLLLNAAVDVLKGAIEACGGKCLLRCPVKYHEFEKFLIVSNEDSKSKYSRFLKHNPKPVIVTAEAIFDAVLRQEINFENHLLL